MNNLGKRLFGFIGRALIGAIIWAIIKANYLGGLDLLPFSTLLIQLLQGIIIGGILGFIFFRLFSYLFEAIVGTFS